MHENVLATLSVTAKYCKDLMPSYTRISKLWQIDVKGLLYSNKYSDYNDYVAKWEIA